LFIFVVVELTLALDDLDVFGLLAAQWVEFALFGLLLVAELTAPLSLDLGSAHNDGLGVGGDSVLWDGVLEFAVGLLGHIAVDLLTALLGLALEVALLDLGVRAGLGGLDETLLSVGLLVQDDGGGGLDLSLLGLASLLLQRVLTLEAVLESGVSLTGLLVVQASTQDALELTLGIATSPAFNGGSCQLNGSWGHNGVLVVVFLLGLLVQLGGQLGVGLFQGLQVLVFGRALVLLLLLATALLLLTTLLLVLLAILVVLVLLLVLLAVLVVLIVLVLLLLVFIILVLVVLVLLVLVLVVIQIQLAIALIATALLLLLVQVVLFIIKLILLI
jgi:hypothetical protein